MNCIRSSPFAALVMIAALFAPPAFAQDVAQRTPQPFSGTPTRQLADYGYPDSSGLWVEPGQTERWTVEASPFHGDTGAVEFSWLELDTIASWGCESRGSTPFTSAQQNYTWSFRWELPATRRVPNSTPLPAQSGFTYAMAGPGLTAFDGNDDCSGTSGRSRADNNGCLIDFHMLITDPAIVARFSGYGVVKLDSVCTSTGAPWYAFRADGSMASGPGFSHDWRVRCRARRTIQNFVVRYYRNDSVPGA